MRFLFAFLLAVSVLAGHAQTTRNEDIHTDFVLYGRRQALEKDLRERVVARHFLAPLDSNSEDGYLSACWAVGQFLFDGPEVRQGFDHLFAGYHQLGRDTKQAFLEAVYAVEPERYKAQIEAVLDKEQDPKLWALGAVYLYRNDTGAAAANALKIRLVERFSHYDTLGVLNELVNYLSYHSTFSHAPTPDVGELFAWRATTGGKTIYSFQRWDRDYPGLAIVQNADGSFVRGGDGRLQVFEQLARSGPGLPYFLTNGNTPQGVYSIQGTDVSRTNFIGPTPNLQLLLPGEGRWAGYFHDTAAVWAKGFGGDEDSLESAAKDRYLQLLPPLWRVYPPMVEAPAAGIIGRTEIIAHGTTIDPEYFKGRPFYPLTPTMGCLCARELWNPTSGHLLVSEQNNLVNAFLSTPGRKGFLIVINVQDRRAPVSRAEVEEWVRAYEKKNPRRTGGSNPVNSSTP